MATQLDPSIDFSSTVSYPTLGRNRLINGEMAIDQRNAGALVSISSTPTFTKFSVDQFWGTNTTGTGVFSVQRVSTTPPIGFSFYSHLVTTTADASPAAGAQYYFYTTTEGLMQRDFLWGSTSAKSVTLSFWVRSSLTGTFSGSIKNDNADRSYVFTYSIFNANTWEYKKIVITGDVTSTWVITSAARGSIITWDTGSGATKEGVAGWQAGNFHRIAGTVRLISTLSATLDITGVQYEIGQGASPFEYRPFGFEFMLCQRYCQKIGGEVSGGHEICLMQAYSTTQASGLIRYPTTMRAAPVPTATGSFIVLSAVASNLAVTGFAFPVPSTQETGVSITVASGLVAGNATFLQTTSAAQYILLEAGLS
jgi:hypothetical protein